MSWKRPKFLKTLWTRIEQDRLGRYLPPILGEVRAYAVMLWVWLEIGDYLRLARRQLVWLGSIRFGMIARGLESAAVVGILVWLAVRGLRSRDETASASATRIIERNLAPIIQTEAPAQKTLEIKPLTVSDQAVFHPAIALPKAVPRQLTRLEQLEQELDAAKHRRLDQLYSSEEYQQAKAKSDELEGRAVMLRKQDLRRELPQVSMEWIQAKNRISTMVSAALSEDPDIASLETQLEDSGILRRGRKIYVFESGAKRSSTTQPAEMKSKSVIIP